MAHRWSQTSPQAPATPLLSSFEPDETLSTVENAHVALYDGMPMPALVRNLPLLDTPDLPEELNEEFSFKFLKKVLGGSPDSLGRYFVSANKGRRAEAPLFPNLRSWAAITRTHNPLLPRFPTQHGARI